MLIKILILVFTINAMIPASFAMGGMVDCKMGMTDSSMATGDNDLMSSAIDDMTCAMHDLEANCQNQCFDSCMLNLASFPIHSAEQQFVHSTFSKLLFKHVYFYQIVLPVNTPPPLV